LPCVNESASTLPSFPKYTVTPAAG
jgi:hypothetical protein